MVVYRIDLEHVPGDTCRVAFQIHCRAEIHEVVEVTWVGTGSKVVIQSRNLAELRVYPTDLGFGKPRSQRGRPMLAGGEMANRVISRVADMSDKYGVSIVDEDGIGVLRF